jgi:L-alanine-DL-glutamate epimerase-like enolase superfamily enzyme
MLELCMIQGPLQWGIFKELPVIENGHILLPNRPGLGVKLAPDAQERFPYVEGHYAITVER